MSGLDRLLRPRSVAVLGAGWAENVVSQCARMGFDGQVWPVHPTRASIGGLRCFPSLQDLPECPDATFLGVNRFATLDLVGQLARMGAGGAVCFASGWAESGHADLQVRLVDAAGAMPILGPNCYGVINYLDGVLLWPDQHGGRRVDKGVALISQSSNIVINLTMQARGLPVAYVACLGNAAQVGLADLARAVLEDPRVTALGLYVEGIGDADAFAALAQAARRKGKGIACLKSGKTAQAQSAAASHTAALAGGGAASRAYLAQIGVAEVETLAALVEVLKIFHVHGPGLGRRLCSLSCSGGEAGLVADLSAPLGLELAPPTQAQARDLGAVLGPLVTVANPLDYHTFIWGDGPRTTQVFATMLAGYDAGIFVIDPPRPDRCDPGSFQPALDAIEAAAAMTGKPAFPVASLPENFDEALAVAMIDRGTVPLMGLETALAALAAAQTETGLDGWKPLPCMPERPVRMLDEAEAKARLFGFGITVPRGVVAPDLPKLAEAAARLHAPLALKALGFAHKTEAGAVALNLGLAEVSTAAMPPASGYLAEEMVQGGRAEMLLGLRRDPVYGATLTLGMGGTLAEVLDDTVTLILPVTEPEIAQALARLRLYPLLTGYRGAARPDLAALASVVLTLQEKMIEQPGLEEIEINPLILRERGAVAVDAVIWESI